MSWDTAIVFCSLILCNLLSSCFQCVTGFGDILCLQILWEVCVSFAPDIFHRSPLSENDFRFITILSYVRSFFVQSVLAGLLFYEEQRVNKGRLLEGLKPLISDFNATLVLSLAIPSLIGAAVGVGTLDYMNEAALRIILGTTSFFFALTFLSLQMMKRLERRKLRDIIRNDLFEMHVSMVLDQQSRQLSAMRKAQERRRARRRRAQRHRRRLQAHQRMITASQTHSPTQSTGTGDAMPNGSASAGRTPVIASPNAVSAHAMSHDDISGPLTDAAAVPVVASGSKAHHDAEAEPYANFSFDDNDSFAETEPDFLTLVRQRLAEMSAETGDQPVDETMRETAHYTLQLLREKEATSSMPGLRSHASRLSMRNSRDNILSTHSGTPARTPVGHAAQSPVTGFPSSITARTPEYHSTLLAGPGVSGAVELPTSDQEAAGDDREESGERPVEEENDAPVSISSSSSSSTSTVTPAAATADSTSHSTPSDSVLSSHTSTFDDGDTNDNLQRILQRAALTGSFAIPATMLTLRPTSAGASPESPLGSPVRRKKSARKSSHAGSVALEKTVATRVKGATTTVDASGKTAGASSAGGSGAVAVAVHDDAEDSAVATDSNGVSVGDASSPVLPADQVGTVLVSANAHLLAEQQQNQLRGLQHVAQKSKSLSAHFVRMDGAVVTGAIFSSFAAGILGSYVGTGDAPHVIFGLAMKIGDAVFRKNMPAANMVPGLLRFILGFTHHQYASELVWYYVASVVAGWAGVLLGLASPVRADKRGYMASVLASLLLASFVTLTDSAWKQVTATALVVIIVAYVIVQEHAPPSMHEVELPPPPSTPTTEAEQVAFSKYWERQGERMARQDRKETKEGDYVEIGVDVKRRARVDLKKGKSRKATDIIIESPASETPVPPTQVAPARERTQPPLRPPTATTTTATATAVQANEDDRKLGGGGDDDADGEILPV